MNRLLNNWNIKLTSLVIAIALWGHVRGEVNPWEDATFRVKMEAPRPPANMMLLNAKDIPATIKVKVTAPRLRLREIKGVTPPNPLAPADEALLLPLSQMRATLDFSLVKVGRQTVPVKIESTLESLDDITPKPSAIELEFAPAASADLRIEPIFSGTASKDYSIDNVQIIPRQARVFGPASGIARVAHLQARVETPAQLSGELSIKAVPLLAVDKAGRVIESVRVDPETAAISAQLREKTDRKSVTITLRLDGKPAPGFIVEKSEPDTTFIAVRGSRTALKALKSVTARLSVEGEKAPLRRPVTLELPEGITLAEPRAIEATVQIVPEASAPTILPTATPELPPSATSPVPEATSEQP